MDHGFIDGISSLVGEDTCRQAGYNLLDAIFVRVMQNVVVDLDVDPLK